VPDTTPTIFHFNRPPVQIQRATLIIGSGGQAAIQPPGASRRLRPEPVGPGAP
jgi:hypothetical protein